MRNHICFEVTMHLNTRDYYPRKSPNFYLRSVKVTSVKQDLSYTLEYSSLQQLKIFVERKIKFLYL